MMNRPDYTIYNDERDTATIRATRVDATTEENKNSSSAKVAIAISNTMEIAQHHISSSSNTSSLTPGQIKHASSTSKETGRATGVNEATLDTELPMPKRNLSAYNLFFQVERENIIKGEEGMNYTHENIAFIAQRHYEQGKMTLPRRKHRKTHGKISFAELARSVAGKWKQLDPSIKEMFVARTDIEKARYQREIAEWADRKLKSSPQLPKPNQHQSDQFSLVDVFRPDALSYTSLANSATEASSNHIDLMPIRVFPPSNEQLNNDQQRPFLNMYTSDSHPFSVPNEILNFPQRQSSTEVSMNRLSYSAADGFEGQALQLSHMNFQPNPIPYHMSLQQQIGRTIDNHGLPYTQGQQPRQFPQPYRENPSHLSMRAASNETSSIHREAFVQLPYESSNRHEMFHNNGSIQSVGSDTAANISTTGPMHATRFETKSSENENIDLQNLFRLFDAN